MEQSCLLSVKDSFVTFVLLADHMHLTYMVFICVAFCLQCQEATAKDLDNLANVFTRLGVTDDGPIDNLANVFTGLVIIDDGPDVRGQQHSKLLFSIAGKQSMQQSPPLLASGTFVGFFPTASHMPLQLFAVQQAQFVFSVLASFHENSCAELNSQLFPLKMSSFDSN
jgi:hypothetical protein